MQVQWTNEFRSWILGLRDERARTRILARLARLRDQDHFGDAKSLGGGVSELRIDYGPGYRVYVTRRGDVLVIVLCGGDKSSQERDIASARSIAEQLRS